MSDIIGIVAIAGAVLLWVAQLSFDRYDVETHRVPANQTVHNWIGSAGAAGANVLFQWCGAGAFLVPVLLLLFGLAHLFDSLAYLRGRWYWAGALFLASLGFFDLHSPLFESLRENLNASSAGGHLGRTMNAVVFGRFGKPGATIILGTVYLVGLIYLTNFRFGEWIRGLFRREPKVPGEEHWTPEERGLARQARELQRKAQRLQEEVERSGLGADLQPVPLPTVRDLSVPQSRPDQKPKSRAAEADAEVEPAGVEGEVIPAGEVRAASAREGAGVVGAAGGGGGGGRGGGGGGG
ncbi:MAG: DNA translocase FtsK 4TM domain-containing protein, partial [Verrucomicrobia bacterium]|nr:DNA translocase FtsK 4TM domain-containing protein [Verrucomicrobiota bacterium]